MNLRVVRSFIILLQNNLNIEKLLWFSFKTRENKSKLNYRELKKDVLEMKIERKL